jgi:hypothetical protein
MATQAKNVNTVSKDVKETTKPTRSLDSNVYRLSNRVLFRQAIFFSKIIIKKHGSVQIEAIGAATSEASKVAQTLVKHGYAITQSIKTEQFVGERGEKDRFQIKIVINLTKSANFDKMTETLVLKE